MTVGASPFPLGVYAIAIRGLITIGSTANTIKDYTVAYSTTTAVTGFISNLYAKDIAVATSYASGLTATQNVSGIYQRTSLIQTYVIIELNTTVFAATGVVGGLIYTITRIA